MIDRILSALVALSLALLVWLYARSRDQEILDNVTLPCRSAWPRTTPIITAWKSADPARPWYRSAARRTASANCAARSNATNCTSTSVLTVPEEHRNESRYSDTVHIDASDVPAPPGVTPIVAEGRNRIPVTVRRMVTRPLPVRFDALQEDPAGPVVLDPPVVLVTGPQEVLDHVRDHPDAAVGTADAAGQRPAHRRRRRPRRPRPGTGRPARSGGPVQGHGQGAAAAPQGIRPAGRADPFPLPGQLSRCGRSSSTTAPAASPSASPGRSRTSRPKYTHSSI